MDYTNHNMTLRTNKHLNFEERFYVEKRIAAGDSITSIATVLGRSRTTIYLELKRASNERHNGLFLRFIPKGKRIENVSDDTLQRALHWCNNLPRKLLHYKTPQEVFLEEVNKIVDLSTVQFHIAI